MQKYERPCQRLLPTKDSARMIYSVSATSRNKFWQQSLFATLQNRPEQTCAIVHRRASLRMPWYLDAIHLSYSRCEFDPFSPRACGSCGLRPFDLQWSQAAGFAASASGDVSPVWPCSPSYGGEPQLFRSDWKFLHAVFEQPGIAVWLGHSVFRQHSPFDRQLLHADHGADRYQR